MILDWRGQHFTTNALSDETSLARNDNGLFSWELAALLKAHGVASQPTANVSAALDKGQPCICLIHYQYISERQNQADLGDHFVVAVGQDAGNMIVLDPDFWGVRRDEGNGLAIPWPEWSRALIEAIAIN